MGRPRSNKTYKQVGLTLESGEAVRWQELADSLHISRTEMLRRAVRALMAAMDGCECGGGGAASGRTCFDGE